MFRYGKLMVINIKDNKEILIKYDINIKILIIKKIRIISLIIISI